MTVHKDLVESLRQAALIPRPTAKEKRLIVLIDEAFIKCAIEHEIQRRERYATSAPIRRNDENP